MQAQEVLNKNTKNKEKQMIINKDEMKAFDGSIVMGWLASQTDMLSEDWQIVD